MYFYWKKTIFAFYLALVSCLIIKHYSIWFHNNDRKNSLKHSAFSQIRQCQNGNFLPTTQTMFPPPQSLNFASFMLQGNPWSLFHQRFLQLKYLSSRKRPKIKLKNCWWRYLEFNLYGISGARGYFRYLERNMCR